MTRLAIHYHKTISPTGKQDEVFLSPELLKLKVYAHAARLDVHFVKENYSSVKALGALPAAFINGSPANVHQIMTSLRILRELDDPSSVQEDALDNFANREGLILAIEEQLSDALDYCLWAYPPAFNKFTKPVLLASSTRLISDIEVLANQFRTMSKFKYRSNMLQSTHAILSLVHSLLPSSRKFIFAHKPMTIDVVIYAYLSPLFSGIVDSQLTPWEGHQGWEHLIKRIKTFLLDIDDWLWQSAALSEPLLSTEALVHIVELRSDPLIDEDQSASKEDETNEEIIARKSERTRGNFLFMGACAGLMVLSATIGRARVHT